MLRGWGRGLGHAVTEVGHILCSAEFVTLRKEGSLNLNLTTTLSTTQFSLEMPPQEPVLAEATDMG